jgi:methyl-accepting chemotaxis protein
MLKFGTASRDEARASLAAIHRSTAVIEFDLSGKVLRANRKFCETMGYREEDLVGRHHSLFCDEDYARTPEYRVFWERLGRGEYNEGECKRRTKSGGHVYLRASYNPVLDGRGKVVCILKIASDVTREKLEAAEAAAKLAALSQVQAVIEFTPSGEVIVANDTFLNLLGYQLDEIKGRHHRMFVDPAFAASPDYEEFWRKLRAGEFVSRSFCRVAKGGRKVWIQASYNPIFDLEGKVSKIVKFATDITDLTHLAAGLSRVAANDIGGQIDTPFVPAFEGLREDFNRTTGNLRGALLTVTESAEAVRSGASEIAAASQDLSARVERQAASLEEAAAALEQVTGTVRSTAEGAKEARDVVGEAQTDAQSSEVIVRDAVSAMERIEKSASEIGQIIGVIDEIAFQTNLLALNAGVEAARAGDAGRGFAVVASEVRALAQRSAEAAKQIKGLIHASSGEVAAGVKLVADAGGALRRIAQRVSRLNEVVQRIAAGAVEQAGALQEVSVAVNEMDQTTQQNAAAAEEMTAACKSLFQEVESLGAEIGKFKLGRDVSVARGETAPRRRAA